MDSTHVWGFLYIVVFLGSSVGAILNLTVGAIPGPFDVIVTIFLGVVALLTSWDAFKYLVKLLVSNKAAAEADPDAEAPMRPDTSALRK